MGYNSMAGLIEDIIEEIIKNMRINGFSHLPIELQNQMEQGSDRFFIDHVLQDVANESFHFPQNANQSDLSVESENTNEKRLEDIKFDFEKTPDAYQCAITYTIMTHPVYAKTMPNVKFERQNILRWLRDHAYHPHIGAGVQLTPQDLEEDKILSEEIDTFVKQQVHKQEFSSCLEGIKNSPRKI